jgi:hypothetical protein
VVDPPPLQVVANRKTGLASTDHDDGAALGRRLERCARGHREGAGLGSEQITRLDQVRGVAAGMGFIKESGCARGSHDRSPAGLMFLETSLGRLPPAFIVRTTHAERFGMGRSTHSDVVR